MNKSKLTAISLMPGDFFSFPQKRNDIFLLKHIKEVMGYMSFTITNVRNLQEEKIHIKEDQEVIRFIPEFKEV